MPYLEVAIKKTLKLYVVWVLRRKTVFVVSGLRRSGNHACIDWLANAVVGKSSNPTFLDRRIYCYGAGECVHLNEVNFDGKINFPLLLRRARQHLKGASTVIISLEDYLSSVDDIYTPKNSKQIFVKRRLLNILASRLTYNRKRAQNGLDRGDMGITPRTFDIYRGIQEFGKHRAILWDYDEWLADTGWREVFLGQIGFENDVTPEVSAQGGGSSFVGRDVSELAKIDRERIWQEIDWPDRVLALIGKNRDLLDSAEAKFIDDLD